MTEFTNNLAHIKARISRAAEAAGRDPADICLLAASKGHPPATIYEAIKHGISDFGENYLQEARSKIEHIQEPVTWHFIGRMQKNKTSEIARLFSWVHTVDRAIIADRLDASCQQFEKSLNVCVQINIANETSKAGIELEQAKDLCALIAEKKQLQLRGLMCFPPLGDEKNNNESYFTQTHQLFESLKDEFTTMDTLSMGTTSDMEIAIANGSTMIRVGRGLMGERSYA